MATGTAVIQLPPGGGAACTFTNAREIDPTPTPTPTPSPTPIPAPTVEPSPGPSETAGSGGDLGGSTGAPGWIGRVLALAAMLLGFGIALWVMAAANRPGGRA